MPDRVKQSPPMEKGWRVGHRLRIAVVVIFKLIHLYCDDKVIIYIEKINCFEHNNDHVIDIDSYLSVVLTL